MNVKWRGLRIAVACCGVLCAGPTFGADAAAAAAAARAPSAKGAPAVTTPAPPTRAVDPGQLRELLARERGKIVILNLWGTWCAPCLKEIPDLVRLQKELAPRGVVLIGVAMDEPRDLTTLVEPFRLKYFPEFLSYVRNAPDMDSVVSVVDPAWNELLPTTYLLGRDGKVARKVQGVKTYEQFREYVLEIAGKGPPAGTKAPSPTPQQPASVL